MNHNVALVDELGRYRLVVNGIYRVLARIRFQMLNIVDGAGRDRLSPALRHRAS